MITTSFSSDPEAKHLDLREKVYLRVSDERRTEPFLRAKFAIAIFDFDSITSQNQTQHYFFLLFFFRPNTEYLKPMLFFFNIYK
ncbi:mitochondrial lipoamide dehydrogenase [Trifolium repens]|nr:mitochondrial lipoamide dehydrogenase [Trifolium repens]